jgi:hypothetical protein
VDHAAGDYKLKPTGTLVEVCEIILWLPVAASARIAQIGKVIDLYRSIETHTALPRQ